MQAGCCRSLASIGRRPTSLPNNVRHKGNARFGIIRSAASSGAPTDTGKIPDNVKVGTSTQSTAPPDNRQGTSSTPTSAATTDKRKGSWTPPYPSLVNNKPLPTEDVKTNIDM